MKDNCLEIGTVQAFLDSELTHEESASVSNHLAACHACALAVSNAENESAAVFAALDGQYNSLVPTQRLWSKINDALETEKENASVWNRARAFVSTALLSPSFAGAAGLLIVFGFISVMWLSKPEVNAPQPGPSTVAVAPATKTSDVVTTPMPGRIAEPIINAAAATARSNNAGFRFVKASFSPQRAAGTAPEAPATSRVEIPGEDSYLKTIDSLAKSVEMQKDSVMRPGERIAYERDMAVVNDAIEKVRNQVRRNPKNESAREVLYSSYQNKIDLLNSVSQKEELVASLR